MAKLDPDKRIDGLVPFETSLVAQPANMRRILRLKSVAEIDCSGEEIPLTAEEHEQVRASTVQCPPQTRTLINKAVRYLYQVRKDQASEAAAQFGWDATTQSILAGLARISSPLSDKVSLSDMIYLLEQIGFADGETAEDDSDSDAQSGQMQQPDGAVVVSNIPAAITKSEDSMADTWDKPEGVDQKTHDEAKAAAMAVYNNRIKGSDDTKKAGVKKDDDKKEEEKDKGKETKKSAKPEEDKPVADEPAGDVLVTKAQKQLQEQYARLVEKNSAMEKQLAEHADYRVTKSIKEQVAADFRHIGGDQDKLVQVLKHCKTLEDTSIENAFVQVLKSCEAQLAASVSNGGSPYEVVGSSSGESADSPIEQLNAMASAYSQKSGGKVSFEQAYDKVTATPAGRALFAQHFNNQKGRV